MPDDTLDTRLAAVSEAVMAVVNPLLDQRDAAIKLLLERNRLLAAELADERATLAKTIDNFEIASESFTSTIETLRAELASARADASGWEQQASRIANRGAVYQKEIRELRAELAGAAPLDEAAIRADERAKTFLAAADAQEAELLREGYDLDCVCEACTVCFARDYIALLRDMAGDGT